MASANLNVNSNRFVPLLYDESGSSPNPMLRAGHCRVALYNYLAPATDSSYSNVSAVLQDRSGFQPEAPAYPRWALTKTAPADPDSGRFVYLLKIEFGIQPEPVPTGSPRDADENDPASATESPDSNRFALSIHDWPCLNEATLQAKKKQGKNLAKGDETDETSLSERIASRIEEQEQRFLRGLYSGVTCGVTAPAGIAPIAVGAVTQDLKVLFVDPSDLTVDNVASIFWPLLPEKWKSGEEERFFLRVDTRTVEFLINCIAPKENNGKAIETMARLLADYRAHVKTFRRIRRTGRNAAEAINLQSLDLPLFTLDYYFPTAMTYGWHMHRVLLEDRTEAHAAFTRVAYAWTLTPAVSEEDITRASAKERNPTYDDR